MIASLDALNELLRDVRFEDWTFRTGTMGDGFFLQCSFMAADNQSPANWTFHVQKARPELQRGVSRTAA